MTSDPFLHEITVTSDEPVLSGVEQGRAMRAKAGLDKLDQAEGMTKVTITEPVVTSSFIRGLIGPSERHLGYDGFFQKYRFDAAPSTLVFIDGVARLASGSRTGS